MSNIDFNKNLFKCIHTASYYPIKRSFGKTLQTCNVDAIIAYAKISDCSRLFDQNIEFLIAGLCYTTFKQYHNYNITKYTNFEEVLRRLYLSGTDSTKKLIESFLKLKTNNIEYFCKNFASLSKKVIPLLHNNESFNYTQLLFDLKNWNSNKIKLKWATKIINTESEEK